MSQEGALGDDTDGTYDGFWLSRSRHSCASGRASWISTPRSRNASPWTTRSSSRHTTMDAVRPAAPTSRCGTGTWLPSATAKSSDTASFRRSRRRSKPWGCRSRPFVQQRSVDQMAVGALAGRSRASLPLQRSSRLADREDSATRVHELRQVDLSQDLLGMRKQRAAAPGACPAQRSCSRLSAGGSSPPVVGCARGMPALGPFEFLISSRSWRSSSCASYDALLGESPRSLRTERVIYGLTPVRGILAGDVAGERGARAQATAGAFAVEPHTRRAAGAAFPEAGRYIRSHDRQAPTHVTRASGRHVARRQARRWRHGTAVIWTHFNSAACPTGSGGQHANSSRQDSWSRAIAARRATGTSRRVGVTFGELTLTWNLWN